MSNAGRRKVGGDSRDERFEQLLSLAGEGGDTGEVAEHSLWVEYGYDFRSGGHE